MQVASPPFVHSLLHLGYAERQPGPTDAFLRSRILLSTILELPLRKALVAQLKGEDAQCVVDCLDRVRPEELLSDKFIVLTSRKILREKAGILATEEGLSILSLLYVLTQSAQIFPQCYELRELDPAYFQFAAAGVFNEIFRARYKDRGICIRATDRFSTQGRTSVSVCPAVTDGLTS